MVISETICPKTTQPIYFHKWSWKGGKWVTEKALDFGGNLDQFELRLGLRLGDNRAMIARGTGYIIPDVSLTVTICSRSAELADACECHSSILLLLCGYRFNA